MDCKRESSPELIKYLNMIDMQEKIVPLCVRLLNDGYSKGDEDYYDKHHLTPGITYIVVSINTPIIGQVEGSAKLIPIDECTAVPPRITKEMLQYECKQYIGFKIYVHPDHMDFSKSILKTDTEHVIKVGFMMVAGRGVITFKVDP